MPMYNHAGSIFDALEAENEVALTDPAAVEENTAELTDAASDIVDTSVEVDNDTAKVTDAIEGGEQLLEVAEAPAQAVENGEGLSDDAVAQTIVAVEHILDRIQLRARPIPSAESFHTQGRLAQTKMTVEGIADVLRTAWAAIKRFAARIWEGIQQLFAKIFSSTGVMKKNLESMVARARKLPAEYTPMESKIKNSSVAKAISVDGKAGKETFAAIAENAAKLSGLAAGVTQTYFQITTAAQKMVADGEPDNASVSAYLDSVDNAAKHAIGLVAGLKTAASEHLKSDPRQAKNTDRKGVVKSTRAFGPFVGNTFLKVTEVTRKLGDKEVSDVTMEFSAGSKKVAESVDALSVSDIVDLGNGLLKMNDAFADFKKVQSENKKVVDATNALTEKVLGSVAARLEKTGAKAETTRALAAARRDVNDALSGLNSFANRAPVFYFNTIHAGAQYMSVSLRNLGEKKSK